MNDPYKVLGTARDASAEELKSAYRKLAKKLHPDANPGDKRVEQRFKEVSQAYSLLRDPAQRQRFDRGEIDANGQERGFAGGRHAGGGRGGGPGGSPFGPDFRPEDLFAEIFGGRRARAGQGRAKGKDLRAEVSISFLEAAKGCKKRVRSGGGKVLEVRIAPGTQDGQSLRLKGQGAAGSGGGPTGDAIVTIKVEAHPHFSEKNRNIHLEVPVTLQEALLGAEITVPTIDGNVTMRIPAGSNSGSTLRLKGKGLEDPKTGKRGDQYLKLRIALPDKPDKDLSDFVETWAKTHSYDPRKKAGLTD